MRVEIRGQGIAKGQRNYHYVHQEIGTLGIKGFTIDWDDDLVVINTKDSLTVDQIARLRESFVRGQAKDPVAVREQMTRAMIRDEVEKSYVVAKHPVQ